MSLDQTQDFQIWGTMTPSYWVAWTLSIPMWVKSPRERDFPAGNLISRQKQSRLQDCVGVCVHGCVPVHAHLCVCTCIPMETQRATSAISPQAPTALDSGMTLLTMPRYFHHQVGTCTGWQNLESPYIVSGAGVKDAPCLLISTPEQREAEGAAYTWWTGYRK